MKKIIIAIDGYSACGKSTTAKRVAAHFNYCYIDTGAMYRAVTYYLLQQKIDVTNTARVNKLLPQIELTFEKNNHTGQNEIHVNQTNVEAMIRTMAVSNKVSEVSAIGGVRDKLVAQQQKMGAGGGVVLDGRDIGTNVFPAAELKVFMTADRHVRAQRRQAELKIKGMDVPLQQIMDNLQHRDHLDETRAHSPLMRAHDAKLLDTTQLTINDQIDQVIAMVTNLIN